MRLLNILLIAIPLSAIGCTQTKQIDWNNSLEITNLVIVEYDEFKKVTRYVGPHYPGYILGSNVFLRAWKYDSYSTITYQIYASSYYRGDWRFYDQAYDSDGNQLDTTVIDRYVISCYQSPCSHSEHIGINISRDYLEKHRNGQIRFKIEGRAGEDIFTIPSSYISAFLNRVVP